MERAAAGEEILVTRRGKPTVRLVGVVPQPPLPTPAEGGESPQPIPLSGMTTHQRSNPTAAYIEALLQIGGQMTLILDYMARHPSPEGDEPFTETLATLLEDVLESETELSAEQLATATQVLASTISAIEDGLFLGEPEPSRDHPSTHPPTATPTAAPNRRSSPDHARA